MMGNLSNHPLFNDGSPGEDLDPEELAIEFEIEFGSETALNDAAGELARALAADEMPQVSFWQAVVAHLKKRKSGTGALSSPS